MIREQIQRGNAICRAAQNLIGTPFRLHGCTPETGLDCIGLVAAALNSAGYKTPNLPPYRLRMRGTEQFDRIAKSLGLMETNQPDQAGDVAILRTGAAQRHLGIRCLCGGLIHADGALGRVIHQPLPLQWPVIGGWRATKSPSSQKSY